MKIYLEIGKKKTIAGALAWPGWSGIGTDEATACKALLAAAPRYAQILQAAQIDFASPKEGSDLTVVERLEGDSTTDFGAPNIAPTIDQSPITAADATHLLRFLTAYWQAFAATTAAAQGKELRKGPRGGGRDLDGIVQHVLHANDGYLRRITCKHKTPEDVQAADLPEELARTQQAIADALAVAVRGELPEAGPRGGVIWRPRYFVRRVGWHILDHIWEIEDRVDS